MWEITLNIFQPVSTKEDNSCFVQYVVIILELKIEGNKCNGNRGQSIDNPATKENLTE